MSDKPFELLFCGELAPGELRAAVQARLARLYGKPAAELDVLFSGAPRVVKRAASAGQLEKVRSAFLEAGAVASIRDTRPAPIAPPPAPATGGDAARSGGERHSIAAFVQRTRQRERGEGLFELENERLLEVNLNGAIWIKLGAMVAYHGRVGFRRENLLEKGLGRLLKRSVTGEGALLTRASGQGVVYLADMGKKITLLELSDEAIFVNGNDVLALEERIDWDVRMMRKVSAVLTGGLFNLHLAGSGVLAITTHYDPLTLVVTPDAPVYTDPNATVAWSATLEPRLHTDISMRTFLGRGSGESIQMLFEGSGFVVVQPCEEATMQRG